LPPWLCFVVSEVVFIANSVHAMGVGRNLGAVIVGESPPAQCGCCLSYPHYTTTSFARAIQPFLAVVRVYLISFLR
jgi:hypothetical protein